MSMPGWDRQRRPAEGEPHGWVQWKCTRVGMDFWCTCGYQGFVSADFAYYLKCPKCERVYMTNGHIELVELTADELSGVNPSCLATDDDYIPDDEENIEWFRAMFTDMEKALKTPKE